MSRQARLIIAAALTALALTGCGSARPGTAPGIPRPAAHPAASSTPPGSYLNPAVVAAALKRMLRNRLADKSGPYYDPGVRPRSVNCVQEAARRDYCVASVSGNNPNVAATVIISPDGGSFVTYPIARGCPVVHGGEESRFLPSACRALSFTIIAPIL